jgi:hypothetical protein
VSENPEGFQLSAKNPGTCTLAVVRRGTSQANFQGGFGPPQRVVLRIRQFSDQREFTPGVSHNHSPCNDWEKVKNHPNSSVVSSDTPEGGDGLVTVIGAPVIGAIVRNSNSPRDVVEKVLSFRFGPVAKAHLNHYLSGGGRDFVEDENIRAWLAGDSGITRKIAADVIARKTRGEGPSIRGHFSFSQSEYENGGFQNAFGAIDRVDYEALLGEGSLRVWFQDRYEWHPVYPGLYSQFSDDERRPTNGLHAAFVEMKKEGAADYWMKGEYTVAL